MSQALLVIDVQNDYFSGGAMALQGMEAAAANCASLIAAQRERGKPVYHVQHLAAQEGATFFVPDTAGAEIHASVTPAADETLIVKHFPSAFRDTDLDAVLREAGITDLVICGAMSHMCIDTTTRAAFDLGYQCSVAADACATRDLVYEERVVDAADVHAAYMAALAAVFAQVKSTADILQD